MGLLNAIRMNRYEAAIRAAEQAPAPIIDPSTYPIASPWSSSDLQRIVFEDIFGSDIPSNTRAAAMRIPAVARARNLLVSEIARNPLVALRREEQLETQPTWLYSAAGGMSPQQRIVWTVDDLIFYGWSCWWRDNGADNFPGSSQRINFGDWSINADNRVEVHGQEVDDRNVIVIPGMHEGILSYGVDALRDIKQLYANVRKRLKNPIPAIDLHQTGGVQLTDPEIDETIARWAKARDGENGGVGYTSEHMQANVLSGGDDGQLMIESRNAAAVDIARMMGVSGSLIDATTPKASLNYETTAGRNVELIDRDLPLYANPIAWRLSLDDVCPRGTRIAFDTSDRITPQLSPTGPTLED